MIKKRAFREAIKNINSDFVAYLDQADDIGLDESVSRIELMIALMP